MADRKPPDKILWLDLETTGSAADSNILEIGLALTDQNLRLIDVYEALVRPPDDLRVADLDPVVLEMHAKSGLWNALLNPPANTYIWRDTTWLDTVINAWIDQHHPYSQHIALAGSGVLHFDRQFIRRDLPRLDKRLTYWGYDVGVIRRFMRDHLDINTPETSANHRALQDVLSAIDEYRFYRDLINKWRIRSIEAPGFGNHG